MTTLTPLPSAPQRADPTTFATRADVWVNALETVFTPQMNLIIPEINALSSAATTGASTATTKASEASASASTASTAASTATTKAAEALVSANSAETSRIQASKLNLGNKSTPPTVDNQGDTLLAGATYYDTTLSKWRVWNGTAWADGISSVAGVSSVNGLTGAVTGIADLTTSQTLTNKTLTAPVVTGVVLNDGYTEEVFTVTGTTPSLSSANGSIQTWVLTANSAPTDGLASGQSIILGIDDGTAFTLTWPTVVWTKAGGSGTAPTVNTTGRTWVALWKVGSTLYGSYLGDTSA